MMGSCGGPFPRWGLDPPHFWRCRQPSRFQFFRQDQECIGRQPSRCAPICNVLSFAIRQASGCSRPAESVNDRASSL
jgi:hypothetical protein